MKTKVKYSNRHLVNTGTTYPLGGGGGPRQSYFSTAVGFLKSSPPPHSPPLSVAGRFGVDCSKLSLVVTVGLMMV